MFAQVELLDYCQDFETAPKYGFAPKYGNKIFTPVKADQITYETDETKAHSGKGSIILHKDKNLIWVFSLFKPGKIYTFNVWVKRVDGNPVSEVSFRWFNKKGSCIVNDGKTLRAMQPDMWLRATRTVKAPPDFEYAYLWIDSRGGSIRVDDLTVKEEI